MKRYRIKRYLAVVCMLVFVGSGFAALAATPASTQETGSGGAPDTSSAVPSGDAGICVKNCSELKQKIRHLESERDKIAAEIRTLKQKEERIAHTIKKVEMAQNDIASNAKRLLGELRAIEKEISMLKEKLLRIEHALHALEMERVKLKDMLNDPNLTKDQRTRILTRLAEIDREMKYLRDVAKDIVAHIMRLREVGHKLVEKLKVLKHEYMLLEKMKHQLLRDLKQIHEKVCHLAKLLKLVDHELGRLIAYYKSHCP